jgi:pimeloyl-ACP methyl ester carboxylesterase
VRLGDGVRELDVPLEDGRNLHVYDTGAGAGAGSDDRLAVVWHHGTPNIGAPPEPLFPAAERLGLRWVSYDRPSYGGSTPHPGRDIASAASDVASIADALEIDRFAVIGHSGGGPHALGCAALLPGRVVAAASVAGLAPYDADGLDWFAGMAPSGVAATRAAADGREAKERFEMSGEELDPGFAPVDWAALEADWAWLGTVVAPAVAAGPAGLIDDDLAYVAPWGFDPWAQSVPALFVHGRLDRVVPCAHGEWLARRWPSAELQVSPDDGHISILRQAEHALEWLRGCQ